MNIAARKQFRICGMDEVGRGAIAGPFVAAAVVLTDMQEKIIKTSGLKIRDSKCLTVNQRETLVKFLGDLNVENAVLVYPVTRINIHGIGVCNMEAFRTLIRTISADTYIVDGKLAPKMANSVLQAKIITQVDADATTFPVMIASVIAKVTRDAIMKGYHERYPHYGWDTNVGYGTMAHINAVLEHGMTSLHRTQFTATAIATRNLRNATTSGTVRGRRKSADVIFH